MHLSGQHNTAVAVTNERRSYVRYPMTLELVCREIGSNESVSGTTSDVGRNGVRFHASTEFPIGATLEVRIQWPTAVPEIFIELILVGSVVRSGGGETALLTNRYGFHDRRMTVFRTHRRAGKVTG